MRIGIVGSEAAKFTPATEALARQTIRDLLTPGDIVVSGGCHLGGIDIWAVEEAHAAGCGTVEFLPVTRTWSGYKARNKQIAQSSDVVYCLTVAELPPTYHGMTFSRCYHCNTDTHVKSGGCWTVKYAIRLGKIGDVIVLA